jgi:SAM-dependent methyltransferase
MSATASALTGLARRVVQRLQRLRPGSGRPVPVAALNAEYASGHWDHFAGADEAARYQAVRDLVRSRHRQPRLLDVGCGSGELARRFAAGELAAYLGVDLAAEGLRRARALGLPQARFVEADFETWRRRSRGMSSSSMRSSAMRCGRTASSVSSAARSRPAAAS